MKNRKCSCVRNKEDVGTNPKTAVSTCYRGRLVRVLAFGDSSVRICSQLWSKKVVPEGVGDRGPEAETRLGVFLSLQFPVTDFSGFSSLFSSCLSLNLVESSALGLQTVHLFPSGPFLSPHLLSPGISPVGMEGITKISCFYENQLGHFLPFFFCLTLFFFPGIPFPFYIHLKKILAVWTVA